MAGPSFADADRGDADGGLNAASEASVTIREGVCFRRVDNESVLLDLRSGVYYSLNEVGTRAWVLLQETHRIETTVAALLCEYDVPEHRLRRDVVDLVARLVDRGLLRVASP